MRIKTSTLEGRTLDYVVATLEGWRNLRWHRWATLIEEPPVLVMDHRNGWTELVDLDYHDNWGMTGPIIDREDVEFYRTPLPPHERCKAVITPNYETEPHFHFQAYGPTKITAALRCFVASRLGDEVEIPDDLL